MSWRVLTGDSLEVLGQIGAGSIDAVVTDPPYGIGFMGCDWDRPGVKARRNGTPQSGGAMEAGRYDLSTTANRAFQGWCEAWAAECLRVLKPGGHLLAFGGTRTYHRLTAGIEDAGFEIRDCLTWLYGSGFPKSSRVSRDPRFCQCDGARDDSDWSTQPAPRTGSGSESPERHTPRTNGSASPFPKCRACGKPDPKGWGTALKPAHEPIVVARKPLAGTVAANVQAHGTGALNIAGCRIGDAAGRWPANVVLDPEAAELLDEQAGTLTSGSGELRRGADKFRTAYGEFKGTDEPADVLYGDSGGASRFFYCAKTSSAERGQGNTHPTVKPVALMRWLVRLVLPPGGTVLDPFTGSGTTGIAALREDFSFVGVEREPAYVAIARQRILDDSPLFNGLAEATA